MEKTDSYFIVYVVIVAKNFHIVLSKSQSLSHSSLISM